MIQCLASPSGLPRSETDCRSIRRGNASWLDYQLCRNGLRLLPWHDLRNGHCTFVLQHRLGSGLCLHISPPKYLGPLQGYRDFGIYLHIYLRPFAAEVLARMLLLAWRASRTMELGCFFHDRWVIWGMLLVCQAIWAVWKGGKGIIARSLNWGLALMSGRRNWYASSQTLNVWTKSKFCDVW